MNIENITGACARLQDRTIKLFIGDPVTVTDRLSIKDGKVVRVSSDILELMNVLNDKLDLWGEKNPLLNDGTMFNGSSQHLMDPTKRGELESVKDSFGDVDIIVKLSDLNKLSSYFDEIDDDKVNWIPSGINKFTEKFHYIGRSKGGHTLPDQVFTFWWYKPQDLVVQIDFEGDPEMYIVYAGKNRYLHPSEWMKFSKMSPWSDLKKGIKGLAGAILLRSLTRVCTKLENVVVLTPSGVKNFNSGKMLTEKDISKNKQHDTPCEFTLNTGGGNQGIRRPYMFLTKMHTGKNAYGFVESKNLNLFGEEYQPITGLEEIFQIIFKKHPTEEEILKFREFGFLLSLMNKYLTPIQIHEVMNRFYEILKTEHLSSKEKNSINQCIMSCLLR